MGYIEKSLASNEVIVEKARFHWLYHVFALEFCPSPLLWLPT